MIAVRFRTAIVYFRAKMNPSGSFFLYDIML